MKLGYVVAPMIAFAAALAWRWSLSTGLARVTSISFPSSSWPEKKKLHVYDEQADKQFHDSLLFDPTLAESSDLA